VLPAAHRLRQRTDFAAAVRHGRRAGRPLLVVHLASSDSASSSLDLRQARAGFVVARTVGGAVSRNQVRRRLRHLLAARIDVLPPGSRLVVRALPAAASATSAQLAVDLDAALARCIGRAS
jgi:ribonuclease P protein component